MFDPGVSPSKIVVFSKFSNVQGIYEEIATHENFPVFAKDGMLLWHEADATDKRRSKWVFSLCVGSHKLAATCIASSAARAEQISPHDLGENVDRIERLVDVVPHDVASAADAIVVESGYSNLDGVYRRQAKAHRHFPVYFNAESGLYVWHDLFRDEWVCSEVVDGFFHFWRVPSSGPRSLSPATSDVRAIEGDSNVTAIYDANLTSANQSSIVLSQMPTAVVVFSKYVNRRGIYRRASAAHEGFPVYTDGENGFSLWHDLGGRWVCSSNAGSNGRRAWRVKSGEPSPDLIPQRDIDAVADIDRIASLANLVPDDLGKAPAVVRIASVHKEVKGAYRLQCGHYLHFAVYYCKETELYLWHDLWEQCWVCSRQVGEEDYMWRVRSSAKSLSPTNRDLARHGVEGAFSVSKISLSRLSFTKLKGKFAPKSADELQGAVDFCVATGGCSHRTMSVDSSTKRYAVSARCGDDIWVRNTDSIVTSAEDTQWCRQQNAASIHRANDTAGASSINGQLRRE